MKIYKFEHFILQAVIFPESSGSLWVQLNRLQSGVGHFTVQVWANLKRYRLWPLSMWLNTDPWPWHVIRECCDSHRSDRTSMPTIRNRHSTISHVMYCISPSANFDCCSLQAWHTCTGINNNNNEMISDVILSRQLFQWLLGWMQNGKCEIFN